MRSRAVAGGKWPSCKRAVAAVSGLRSQHPSAGSAESVTELLTRCSGHQGKAGPVADQTCQDLPRISKMAKRLNMPRKKEHRT